MCYIFHAYALIILWYLYYCILFVELSVGKYLLARFLCSSYEIAILACQSLGVTSSMKKKIEPATSEFGT